MCVRRRAVIRWPYFISAWSPFGMSPTHSAILHDSIATPAFYLALLHQPYFSFLIYWGPEHNLNDGVIFPAWRLVWIGERMGRIKREGKVITALLLDYWFSGSRTRFEIRECYVLKVLQRCIFIELWTSHTFVIFTLPWDNKKRQDKVRYVLIRLSTDKEPNQKVKLKGKCQTVLRK